MRGNTGAERLDPSSRIRCNRPSGPHPRLADDRTVPLVSRRHVIEDARRAGRAALVKGYEAVGSASGLVRTSAIRWPDNSLTVTAGELSAPALQEASLSLSRSSSCSGQVS